MADKNDDEQKQRPNCGRCMDTGFVVVTYITDEGTQGTFTSMCSH